MPTVDLTSLAPGERESRLQQIIKDDAHTPFDLSKGPLVRAQLIKMTAEHQILHFHRAPHRLRRLVDECPA